MALPDRVAAVLLALIAAGSATADGLGDRMGRALELPAHRRLADLRGAPGASVAPFTTDGCSGGMSDLWALAAERFPAFAAAHQGVPPWQECCVTHDRTYHTGGPDPSPEASYAARLSADEALYECVRATASGRDALPGAEYGLTPAQVRLAYGAIAGAMYRAVRLGGGPCSGLPWRWGYGWPQCRGGGE
ncbi:hypothetical protein [Tropicimonas sp.]|uniref:hypothetical protein n=1 Tax=Tropicimonas sp. TaxID=2067044 RepID=UPI003A83DA2D